MLFSFSMIKMKNKANRIIRICCNIIYFCNYCLTDKNYDVISSDSFQYRFKPIPPVFDILEINKNYYN
jgi:hypothetical protein